MLIVFDLDGTLVDSRRDLADSANDLLAGYGVPPMPEALVTGMVGNGAPALVQRVCAAAGFPEVPVDALARFLTIYDSRLLDHTRPYEGTWPMLDAIAGRHRLAVLTNKPTRPAAQVLAGLGLAAFFTRMVGGDGPWPRKPDPAGLQALMQTAPGHTAMLVGDSRIDRETAQAAGVPFCLARYGFGCDAELPAMADFVIDRPIDLVSLLERLAARLSGPPAGSPDISIDR